MDTRASLSRSNLHNIDGLRPFVTLRNFEFHCLTLVQSLKSIPLNRGVMNENIATALFFNETVSFRIVKPLYFSDCHPRPPVHVA